MSAVIACESSERRGDGRGVVVRVAGIAGAYQLSPTDAKVAIQVGFERHDNGLETVQGHLLARELAKELRSYGGVHVKSWLP